jgi:hypothetical protein
MRLTRRGRWLRNFILLNLTVSVLVAFVHPTTHQQTRLVSQPRPATGAFVSHPDPEPSMLRHVKIRAARAAHRHQLNVLKARAARIAQQRALAEQRLLWNSAFAWAHTPKAIGVANCESGPGPDAPRYDRYVGDPHLNDPNGHYGKWQFAPGTAYSVGAPGAGIANLPEAEQDYYAHKLWQRDGWAPWQCAGMV